MAQPSPAGHAVSSISNPQNPAEALTDGMEQLSINKDQPKGGQQQQQQKKEKKEKKKESQAVTGDSSIPLEVSQLS